MTEDVWIKKNSDEVSLAAAEEFLRLAMEGVERKGIFTVALSGGSTPRGLYSLLGSEAYSFKDQVPWDKIHFFWGDERYVPQDHPDSNFRMVQETLLSKVPVIHDNVHPVNTGTPDAEMAARDYEKILRKFFELKHEDVPQFDLILLGMGQDGHTASIFPETDAVKENNMIVISVSDDSVKIPRITVTPPVINNALNIIFLVTGREKSLVLQKILRGNFRPEKYPAQLTRYSKGILKWLIDTEAAAHLKNDLV
jgi:6-phosphogluconolactonase